MAGVPHVKKDPKMGVILSVLLFLVLLLGSGFLFLIKTGGLTTTSTSHPSTTTSQTPLATPGIGVPVVGGNWEVTIKRVHQESKLNGNFGIQTQTYTPHSGFTFLVVDIKLRNLASPDQVQVSTKMFALLGSDGTISTPDLVGAAPGLDNYAPGVASITSYGKALEESLVFVLEETQIRQVFQFQFQKVPLTHETIM